MHANPHLVVPEGVKLPVKRDAGGLRYGVHVQAHLARRQGGSLDTFGGASEQQNGRHKLFQGFGSVVYIRPRYAGGMYSYPTEVIRYGLDTHSFHRGYVLFTVYPTEVVRHGLKYLTEHSVYRGYVLFTSTEVVRYGLNTLRNTPVWFGTNPIHTGTPTLLVSSVRPPKNTPGMLRVYIPYRTYYPCGSFSFSVVLCMNLSVFGTHVPHVSHPGDDIEHPPPYY